MKKTRLQIIGSQTAKQGFQNEAYILEKFNNWQKDKTVQKWLSIMGYVVDKIENIQAIKLPNKYKADISVSLKIYTKQSISTENLSIKLVSNPKGYNQIDKRRMFFNEMTKKDQHKVLSFFFKNKEMIISDLLRGRGKFSADWMLVILKIQNKEKWTLKSIYEAIRLFAKGEIMITSRGSLKIGNITVQRKGGDGGRDTAKMLQFKINPVELF